MCQTFALFLSSFSVLFFLLQKWRCAVTQIPWKVLVVMYLFCGLFCRLSHWCGTVLCWHPSLRVLCILLYMVYSSSFTGSLWDTLWCRSASSLSTSGSRSGFTPHRFVDYSFPLENGIAMILYSCIDLYWFANAISFKNMFIFQVYFSIYFSGHIFFIAALLVLPYLRKVLVPRKRGSEKKED